MCTKQRAQSSFKKHGKQFSKNTVGGETGKLKELPVASVSVSALLSEENGALRENRRQNGDEQTKSIVSKF